MKSKGKEFRFLFIIADFILVVMIAFVALLIVNKFSNDLGYSDVVALDDYKERLLSFKPQETVMANYDSALANDEDVVVDVTDSKLAAAAAEAELKKAADTQEKNLNTNEKPSVNSDEKIDDLVKNKEELDSNDASSESYDKVEKKIDNNEKLAEKSLEEKTIYSCKDVSEWIVRPSTYTGSEKLVFLTFDDGPSVYTYDALDILKEENVKASFFVMGICAEQKYAGPILKRQMNEGHSVGLHSHTHEYSFLYPSRIGNKDNILFEVDKNTQAIRKHLGDEYVPSIFRYPGGHMSWKQLGETDKALAEMGINYIDWNVGAGDAVYKNNPKYNITALENIRIETRALGMPNVVVVLMHDSKDKSTKDLKAIIEYFRVNGYKFGTLK